ncbi:ribosomal-processing cysteine protease Prp [Bacillus canaveralius]|uniref:Ribosomal processing cysteine protease Prp n=1 Tax=Bacillus canaveralius TaxID=1403243 RepID=A0A2N5GFM8_9BACI|nr:MULTISPECIES: ribosomal-processing cysteine protease Prp [Bacillus]PLR79543.1 ribosomal-processing cysteine protease Prp [Bacillus canaveralius]PLR86277.1 ribosomal-processing cysteine protease Prp [Bacillus sp. V33-4]PLR89792.1 ribosomal-processing cysteine protease Prp [Bacillus canaveralius]RSK52426.1 ribosomal-processing cysteine protease Prp [Bacillus canaveralius]
MIKITINRSETGMIQSFIVSGHAEFADPGEDIVCAGISAVSFGSVNSIIGLTGIEPVIEQGENGFLRCEIPGDLPVETQEKVQLLLEGMVISLQTIERDYGNYIKINFR